MQIKISSLATALMLAASWVPAAEIFVAPDGNDNNPGTLEKPLKTPVAGRDAIRKLHKQGKSEKSTVLLRGGIYWMDQTLLLEPQDSGITFKAYHDETPILNGATKITNWKRLTAALPEINPKAKGRLYTADIKKGWRFHFMYINGRRAQRSRWINNDRWRNWPKDHAAGKPQPKQAQRVTLKQNKDILQHIPSNGDAEMVCIIAQYGVMGNGVITDVNPANGTFRWNSRQLTLRGSRNPHERGYNLENALWLIDQPGEWAVDSDSGKVYYWPLDGEDMEKADVLAPRLYEIVRLQGNSEKGPRIHDVTLDGLTLKYTDRLPENQWPYSWLMRQWENVDATLYISGAENCNIINNRILYSGAYGITLNHYAQKIQIVHNEVGWTGSGGIFLEGYGPGTLDVNRDNTITYNYIHDHGLANYWHSPSLQVYQSGHNYFAYNLMQRSAYSGFSMVGMHPKYMNQSKYMVPGTFNALRHEWNYFCPRIQDFPKDIQNQIRQGTAKFDRTTMKPYMHSRNNLAEKNVVVEPHSLLNEGGAFYTWCPGKDNLWRDNIVYVSHAMPGSSIYALDDLGEYFTVVDNVFWVNGKILNGVGARSNERGNTIHGNHRVMFKPQYAARRKRGLGSWWTNETGRESLDSLYAQIRADMQKSKWKDWPGNPSVGIPGLDKVTKIKHGPEIVLPEGSHVTIEE